MESVKEAVASSTEFRVHWKRQISESTKCELDRKNSLRCRGTECPGQWHKAVCPRKASQGYLNRKPKHGRSKTRRCGNSKPREKIYTHKGKERKNAVQRPCHGHVVKSEEV